MSLGQQQQQQLLLQVLLVHHNTKSIITKTCQKRFFFCLLKSTTKNKQTITGATRSRYNGLYYYHPNNNGGSVSSGSHLRHDPIFPTGSYSISTSTSEVIPNIRQQQQHKNWFTKNGLISNSNVWYHKSTTVLLNKPIQSSTGNSSNISSVAVAAENSDKKNDSASNNRVSAKYIVSTAVATFVACCYVTRKYRDEYLLPSIPLLHDTLSANEIESIRQTVQRMGLMGKRNSVKDELDDIRQWHIAHGFKGGLVLRDLTKPLYSDDDNDSESIEVSSASIVQKTKLEQRECYYLYYEFTSTGAIVQQLFCRGTTLLDDIITCIQCWMVYDNDCQCYIHKGFRDHADRVLNDVLPLLVHSSSSSSSSSSTPRSTIELYGHSLGGATASILSVKLRRRGYNVTKLITVGEPLYLYKNDGTSWWNLIRNNTNNNNNYFRTMVPKYHIRIENEFDIVPYVPLSLFGFTKIYSNKIWLLPSKNSIDGSSTTRFVRHGGFLNTDSSSNNTNNDDDDDTAWTESCFWNFRFLETVMTTNVCHRIPNYVKGLQ